MRRAALLAISAVLLVGVAAGAAVLEEMTAEALAWSRVDFPYFGNFACASELGGGVADELGELKIMLLDEILAWLGR